MDIIRHSFSQTRELHYSHVTSPLPLSAGHYSLHTHEVCELLLFKGGSATYIVEGRSYPLQKNSLVITRPATVHAIRIDSDEPYERYNLLFDLEDLMESVREGIPKSLDVLHLDSSHVIVNLFQKMDHYFQQLPEPEFNRVLSLLIEEVFFNIRLAAEQHTEQSAVSSNPLIQQAIAYIEENITTLTGIEDICSALFITKSHLHHLFSRHMRITPKQYILSKRLSLAQQAIRSGSKPTEVYLQYGFNNYATFFRDYKRYFGCRPSDEQYTRGTQEILF